MARDGDSEESAEDRINIFKEELEAILVQGDYNSAAELVEYHFGLEPDYLEEFIFFNETLAESKQSKTTNE